MYTSPFFTARTPKEKKACLDSVFWRSKVKDPASGDGMNFFGEGSWVSPEHHMAGDRDEIMCVLSRAN